MFLITKRGNIQYCSRDEGILKNFGMIESINWLKIMNIVFFSFRSIRIAETEIKLYWSIVVL